MPNAAANAAQIPAPQPLQLPKLPTLNVKVPNPTVERVEGGGFRVLMPTSVVQMPEQPAFYPKELESRWTKKVHVEFGNKNWDARDIDAVVAKLGIDKAKVPSQCYVQATGSVVTDEMVNDVNTGTQLQADVGYSGALRTLTATIIALCKAGDLPPNQGFVMQIGNRYKVDLDAVHCNLPDNAAPKRIVIDRSSNKIMGSICLFE